MATHCKNCNTSLMGEYCHTCGQKSHTHRIDSHEIIHDAIHSIWHIDKGFFYTIIQLFLNPKQSLNGYIEGKRVKFFKPLAYILMISAITLAIITGINTISGKPTNHQTTETIQDVKPTTSTTQVKEKTVGEKVGTIIGKITRKYLGFFFLGIVPLLALFCWLFFKNTNYNYWEHFVINIYILAQANFLILALFLFSKIYSATTHVNIGIASFTMNLGLFGLIAFLTIYYYLVYYRAQKIVTFLKSLCIPLLGILSLFIVMGIIGSIF